MEQLVYKGDHSKALVGQHILFNWCAVGWCQGTITSANSDGRYKVKVGSEKKTVNFLAEYSDETVAKHVTAVGCCWSWRLVIEKRGCVCWNIPLSPSLPLYVWCVWEGGLCCTLSVRTQTSTGFRGDRV